MFLVNFTCPETGKRAAAVVPDVPETEAPESSPEVLCPSCGWLHSVDVEPGKMAADNRWAQVRGNPS
jgi:hypothetical protein